MGTMTESVKNGGSNSEIKVVNQKRNEKRADNCYFRDGHDETTAQHEISRTHYSDLIFLRCLLVCVCVLANTGRAGTPQDLTDIKTQLASKNPDDRFGAIDSLEKVSTAEASNLLIKELGDDGYSPDD
jgi:hypothetical protein